MSDTLNSPQGDGNRPGQPHSGRHRSGSDTLNSPQGDGNCHHLPIPGNRVKVRHPQFPARGRKLNIKGLTITPQKLSDTLNSPQGDGNQARLAKIRALTLPDCQTPSIPRKGTETQGSYSSRSPSSQVRHPQFPARGRKRSESLA